MFNYLSIMKATPRPLKFKLETREKDPLYENLQQTVQYSILNRASHGFLLCRKAAREDEHERW